MDSIDLRLIDLLRENARSSYAELARKVGLSAPAVHERVGKLEAAGTIRGYRADVDHEALGLGVTALIGIIEDSGADTDDVLAAVRAMPEVESCYFMAGVESYQLIVRAMRRRKQILCIYDGFARAVCPMILGHKNGRERVFDPI